ncbi:hypothetical protein B5F08_09945 [Anaeromassilibacillus sp. An172]|nr:hypothetical protein B5F08_09945 [Anaeromassilibacillus sp. An172]
MYRKATSAICTIYVPAVLDTKKKPFSSTEIPKNGIKQGLSRSISDVGSPYLLYEIVIYWSVARCNIRLAVYK